MLRYTRMIAYTEDRVDT